MDHTDAHLIALAEDYVAIVDVYKDDATAHGISGARTVAHEALLDYTGLTRATVTYQWCRNLLYTARLAQGEG